MTKFSIITVCTGRLHHLKQTLPVTVNQGADEIIVVDYDCPDGTGDWVNENFPKVKVVREHDPRGFCITRARNLGVKNSSGEALVFVDADVILADKFLDWIRANIKVGHFCKPSRDGPSEVKGTYCCLRSDFDAAGGYDEAIRGWGGEDIDLYLRLQLTGLKQVIVPGKYLTEIKHSNDERITTYSEKDFDKHLYSTRVYVSIKYHLIKNSIYLSLEDREKLFELIYNSHLEDRKFKKFTFSFKNNSNRKEVINIGLKWYKHFFIAGKYRPYISINKKIYNRIKMIKWF